MKKLIVLLFFFFCHYSVASQQNRIIVKYKTQIKSGEIDPERKVSQSYILTKEEISKLEFEFIYNNKKSVFREKKNLDLNNKTKYFRKMAKTIISAKGDFYTDLNKNIILNERDYQGEFFIVKSKFGILDWKLTKETTIIKNFNCYKATSIVKYKDRNGVINSKPIIAWYSPSIPISLGPKDYNGLPGLILKLIEGKEEKGIEYYASEIYLNPKKLEEIILPSGDNILTKDEFEKITEKVYLMLKE